MKKRLLIFFIFLPLYAQEKLFIPRLSSRDFMYAQYQDEVELAEKFRARAQMTDTSILNYYYYKTQDDDSIISVASRCSLWQETLATVNSISQASDSIKNKTLILPVANGLYIQTPPVSNMDYLLTAEYSDKIETSGIKQKINGKNFVFISGERLSPSLRLYFLDSGIYLPLEKKILTSGYGRRKNPITGNWKFHNGIDLASPESSKVMACKSGKIKKIYKNHPLYGKCVIISHPGTTESLYAHLRRIDVIEGQTVSTGYKIGEVGTTGQTTGPHLHFELLQNGKSVNPESILK